MTLPFVFSFSFLPLCSHSQILRHTYQSGADRLCFEATLTVGLPPFFQETYTSAVTVIPDRLTVETVSISSKHFDSLKSRWQLSNVVVDEGVIDHTKCAVDFGVEMTVSDPLIIGTLEQVLQQVAGRQVDAFAARCRQIPIPPDLMEGISRQ
jgi:ribosome-associated toxin RatA of RatAB toxin-antitoxin module